MSKTSTALLFGVILALGAGVFWGLRVSKKEPKKRSGENKAAVVEVLQVNAKSHDIRIRAQGTVVAAEQVELQAEVGGRVTWMSPQVVPGGHFKKGETLLRIDSRAYSVAVHQGLAAMENAKLNLELEKGRQAVAKREWELLAGELPDADSPAASALALRKPQMQAATVQVSVAQSQVDRARLDLDRTRIRAPFDGFFAAATVNVGQLMAPGVGVGRLVASDEFWVQVSVPLDLIASVPLPSRAAAAPGAEVEVTQSLGNRFVTRRGRVLRMLSNVDPVGRLARYVVSIEDPLALKPRGAAAQSEVDIDDDRLPMLLGSYVNVEIHGTPIPSAIELPRAALHNNNIVQVYRRGSLALVEVDIVWRRDESVLIGGGLEDGAQVITSRLPVPLAGMALRLPEERSEKANSAEGDSKADKDGSGPKAEGETQAAVRSSAASALANKRPISNPAQKQGAGP